MKLVIVESPTKAKTLSKILGKEYTVKASLGHVRDLPKSGLGVDVEHNFEPQYVVPEKSEKVIRELKKDAKEAEEVVLATDPDREGEAIAWHLKYLIDPKKYSRAVFHEITEAAVKHSFEEKWEIDEHLVDAQQARRVLDRLVGYKLSPLLWKKVRYGLSAGRVQSAAIRLIVEREDERKAFKPKEYWKIRAIFTPKTGKDKFEADLVEFRGKKYEVNTEKVAKEVEVALSNTEFAVNTINETQKSRNPYPPYKTSTLQQGASNAFGFTSSRTMKSAQKLFERGYITYHRTDSFNLSQAFLNDARGYLAKKYGKEFIPEKPNFYKSKGKNAQEAHEAIRVTNVTLEPSKLSDKTLNSDDLKVYGLIYTRSLQCQMSAARYLQTQVNIVSKNEYGLRATGSVILFEGFLAAGFKAKSASDEQISDKEGTENGEGDFDSRLLPKLKEGQALDLLEVLKSQHFTMPPARYTDASLVKALEELGIGRPSTYAPTIQTIQSRGYVVREGRNLVPQDVAFVVTGLLRDHFAEVVDYSFTAKVEEELDEVAEGKLKWQPVIKEFYEPFVKNLEVKESELSKRELTYLGQSDEICPECGRQLMFKLGKYGKFLSCSGYPECKYAKPVMETIQSIIGGDGSEGYEAVQEPQDYGTCEVCGEGKYILREGRFGKFLACSRYPKCKSTKPFLQRIGMTCPKCSQGDVVVKKAKRGIFYGCSRYPDCDYSSWKKPVPGEPYVETEKKSKKVKKGVKSTEEKLDKKPKSKRISRE